MDSIFKPTLIALAAMLSAVMEMTAPMVILTGCFVIADVVTAYRLQRRLAKAGKYGDGKARFSSARFSRIFGTIAGIMSLLILAAMADYLVLEPLGIASLKYVAGAICFWQAVSILENEAAENNAPWAMKARKFLVDKAKRYLDG